MALQTERIIVFLSLCAAGIDEYVSDFVCACFAFRSCSAAQERRNCLMPSSFPLSRGMAEISLKIDHMAFSFRLSNHIYKLLAQQSPGKFTVDEEAAETEVSVYDCDVRGIARDKSSFLLEIIDSCRI